MLLNHGVRVDVHASSSVDLLQGQDCQGALHQSFCLHDCCLTIAVPVLFVAWTLTSTGFASNRTGNLIEFACDFLQRSTAFS